jgi:hypothetical protein
MGQEDHVNTMGGGAGNSEIRWIGTLLSDQKDAIKDLAVKVDRLKDAIASDMKEMRTAFHNEVVSVDNRVDKLETRIGQLEVTNKILAVVGSACLIGLIAIAIPRIFNPPVLQSQPTQAK